MNIPSSKQYFHNSLFFLAAAALGLGACQKELTDDSLPPYCAPSQITISADGAVAVQFNIGYDSAMQRANTFAYTVPGGPSASYTISYAGDSVKMSNGTWLVLDGSGRIRSMHEAEGMLTDAGDFFYTYNQGGQMTERLFDDGVSELERYSFTYSGDQLNAYTLDALGVTGLGTGSLSFSSSPKISGYALLQYFELLPELMPYAMLGSAGALTGYPITTNVLTINIPGAPLDFTSTYSGYAQNSEGYPTSFQAAVETGSGSVSTLSFSIEYRCL